MRKNLKLLLIVSNLLLSACAKPEFTDGYPDPKLVRNHQTALIIAKVSVLYKDVLNKPAKFPGFLVIQNLNNPELKYKIDGRSYKDSISKVQPGTYNLTSYGYSDGTFEYRTKAFKNDDLVKYGTLKVKPGDCLYLGDFSLKKNDSIIDAINITSQNKNVFADLLKNSEAAEFADKFVFYELITKPEANKQN